MIRVVQYESIDPQYETFIEKYIGSDGDELDRIQYETEEGMCPEHPAGIMFIYKKHILKEE